MLTPESLKRKRIESQENVGALVHAAPPPPAAPQTDYKPKRAAAGSSLKLQPHPVPPLFATPEKQPAPPTADVPSTTQRRRPHFADQLKMDNIGVWDMHLTVYLRS